jgi:hypothetical protein
MILLSNASATSSPATWGGGRGVFSVSGTFAGATVSLEALGPDGSTYIPISGVPALTNNGSVEFVHPPGRIRAAVSGGAPAALYARAEKVRRS